MWSKSAYKDGYGSGYNHGPQAEINEREAKLEQISGQQCLPERIHQGLSRWVFDRSSGCRTSMTRHNSETANLFDVVITLVRIPLGIIASIIVWLIGAILFPLENIALAIVIPWCAIFYTRDENKKN